MLVQWVRASMQKKSRLQHLQGTPCDARVAQSLVTTAEGADPTLAELALGALETWSGMDLDGGSPKNGWI